jgi:hypothetical protein
VGEGASIVLRGHDPERLRDVVNLRRPNVSDQNVC